MPTTAARVCARTGLPLHQRCTSQALSCTAQRCDMGRGQCVKPLGKFIPKSLHIHSCSAVKHTSLEGVLLSGDSACLVPQPQLCFACLGRYDVQHCACYKGKAAGCLLWCLQEGRCEGAPANCIRIILADLHCIVRDGMGHKFICTLCGLV